MPARIEMMHAINSRERYEMYFLMCHRLASDLFHVIMAKQPGYQNSSYKLCKLVYDAMELK
jgi:hypothetical protein